MLDYSGDQKTEEIVEENGIVKYNVIVNGKLSYKRRPYFRLKNLNKSFLTDTELNLFKSLNSLCSKNKLYLFPQVVLSSFIRPNKQEYLFNNLKKKNSAYEKLFYNYLYGRSVDFLICNNDMSIRLAIELLDKTHNNFDRLQSDDIKSDFFKQIDIPLRRIIVSDKYDEDELLKILGISE